MVLDESTNHSNADWYRGQKWSTWSFFSFQLKKTVSSRSHNALQQSGALTMGPVAQHCTELQREHGCDHTVPEHLSQPGRGQGSLPCLGAAGIARCAWASTEWCGVRRRGLAQQQGNHSQKLPPVGPEATRPRTCRKWMLSYVTASLWQYRLLSLALLGVWPKQLSVLTVRRHPGGDAQRNINGVCASTTSVSLWRLGAKGCREEENSIHRASLALNQYEIRPYKASKNQQAKLAS